MSQKRKKREIVWQVRVTCYTDFMEEFIKKTFLTMLNAMQTYCSITGKSSVKIGVKEI